MSERHLTRRALFGGSLVVALAACEPLGRTTDRPEQSPELATLRRAISAEEALLARYEAARGQHPELADTITAISDDHRAHLRALRARVSPSPTPTGSTKATSAPATSVPRDRAGALRALAERERAAADARLRDLAGAPPFLAQLLASIGAAEATHATLLEDPQG